MEFTCCSAGNLLPVFFLELLHGLHTWLLLCVASEDTPVCSSEGADITCVHMFRTTPSILCAYSFDSMVDQRTSFPQLIMCFSRKVPPSSEEQTLHAVQAPPFPWSSHDRKLVSGANNLHRTTSRMRRLPTSARETKRLTEEVERTCSLGKVFLPCKKKIQEEKSHQ